MARPEIVEIDPPASWRLDPEEFLFIVWIREGASEPEPFNVAVSKTQAIVAGFGDEGPTVEWVRQCFSELVSGRLSNYEPVLTQMEAWESPIVLRGS